MESVVVEYRVAIGGSAVIEQESAEMESRHSLMTSWYATGPLPRTTIT